MAASRNIFISFLGAIRYFPTSYYYQPDKSDAGQAFSYVQEAIFRKMALPWKNGDKVFICVTEEARQNNYSNRIIHFDVENRKPVLKENEGLESRLQILKEEGIINHFDFLPISDGQNEKEIWQIFKSVLDVLEDGDQLYLDVTFGFRFLPMLAVSLANYAKALKEVELAAIYYGNYEAGRAMRDRELNEQIEKGDSEATLEVLRKKPIEAPILNLKNLSELQEWTAASRDFINNGRAKDLSALISKSRKDLGNQLLELEQAISFCRGLQLAQDFEFDALQKSLQKAKEEQLAEQLTPLIKKINDKVSGFKQKNTLANGFAAVEWCKEHDLIQQAITFLQETLKSYVIEQFFDANKLTDHFTREVANSVLLNIKKKKNRNFDERRTKEWKALKDSEKKDMLINYEKALTFFKAIPDFFSNYRTLSMEFRNDINHGGHRKPYLPPKILRKEFIKYYEYFKQVNLNENDVEPK